MERKKKVKKRENQPTIDPFSPGGVGGWWVGSEQILCERRGQKALRNN